MYRVVIVDDEEPVLDSFIFIFNKYVQGFKIFGKARSGNQAIEVIKEFAPDLVFMDIQMPGVNGIDVIKQLRPMFPNTVFILATAYERFDIAQKAIKLGIFSYLVKPVSKNTILDELVKVKSYLDSLKETKNTQIEKNRLEDLKNREKKTAFISSLMWKNPTKDDWDNFSKIAFINCNRAAVYILEIKDEISDFIKVDIYNRIIKQIEYKYNYVSSNMADKLILLFPEEKSLVRLTQHISFILKNLEQYNIQLGSGSVYGYERLGLSFREAYTSFLNNDDGIILEGHRKIMESVYRDIIDAEVENGKIIFEDFWLDIFNNNDFLVSKGKMVSLFTLLLQKIDILTLKEDNFDIDPAEEIMPIETIEKWQQWSTTAIGRFYRLLELDKGNNYPKILKKALEYITENYNSTIQLSTVAEKCLVSTSYLSRLFSEHLNKKFIDYVNQLRINRAILLLKEKNITIKEASYMVGYHDPNYFSRTFRKYMGVSPSSVERRFKND